MYSVLFFYKFNMRSFLCTGENILATLVNDMKTQSNRKRFYSPDDIDSIWQLLYPKHFINALLIHHIKQREEEEITEIATIMKQGLIHYDDKSSIKFKRYISSKDNQPFHKKFETSKISDMFKSFQIEGGAIKEPKLVLIDGAPGMGKTTLCKEIAYQWSNGKLLVGTQMVFLLLLRDPNIKKIHDLKDFIHYFYKFEPAYLDLSKKCAKSLTKRDNSDITILMDGYDEFSDKNNDLLIKIIQRDILSQCKLVITSRPIASEKLQKQADVRVEILGFITEESKREYIEKELQGNPNKVESFLTYLDNHSDINKVCYIPIMMTILVHTFKQCEELPTNQSAVYEKFVTLAISRCLQKLDDTLPKNKLSLNKLPEKYQSYLQQLSEFAFKTIRNDKIIFSDLDIENLSPNLAFSSRELQGLGLFKATENYDFKTMDERIWYNFLHLSVHEFLAGYYLKSLKLLEQFHILKETFFIQRYINVWVMFIGLKHNVTCDFHQFSIYSHTHGASNADVDQMKMILQRLHLPHLSNIKSINISNIKGSFQFYCCKNSKDNLEASLIDKTTTESFDSSILLSSKSKRTQLFVSLCSVDNDDQLVEVYLLDKNTQEISYHGVVRELEENQNLSVVLLSNNTFVGYRSNYHQLTSALKLNGTVENMILNYCHISNTFANSLSSYFVNSHYLKCVSITNCKVTSAQPLLRDILLALKESCKLVFLDLSNNKINGQVAEEIANVIKNNPNLKLLNLANNNLGPSAVVILQTLKNNSQLTSLNLCNNMMTGQVAGNIASVIKSHSGLEQLYLSDNDLKLSVGVVLKALQRNSNLKCLFLHNNHTTGQIAKDLANVIKTNSSLEELGLSGNDLRLSAIEILQALKGNFTLKVLGLGTNNMTGDVVYDLANIIKNNSNLEQLGLGLNKLGPSTSIILQSLQNISKLKFLNLSSNSMTGQVAEDLANVIKNNSNLEELILEDNKFGPSAVVIVKALEINSKLKVLSLNGNNMTAQVAEHLANVIKSNLNLEILGLSQSNFGPSTIVILRSLKCSSKLTFLNLSNNTMIGRFVEDLANVIISNSGLEQLYLSDNNLKSSVVVILKALQENSKLKILNLSSNNMTEQVAEDIGIIIKNNSDLEELYLHNNDLKSSAAVILKALQGNSKLKVLDLGCNNMTGQVAEDVAIIITNNSGLEELYLHNNDLKSSAVVILKALQGNSKLKVLNLGSNNMTGQVAEDVAIIIKNNSDLEKLDLFDNDLKSSAVVILKALQGNSKLKVLNLGSNNMTGQVAEDVAIIIKNNSGLEELYLYNNDLKSSAIVILKALQGNSKLKVLNLGSNNMTGQVAEDVAIIIKNNSDLEKLDLFDNDLKSSAVVILKALQGNSKLKVLNLGCNNMTGQVAEDVAIIITNNSGLEELYLHNNDLKSSAVVILKALQGNSKLKAINLNSNNMTEEVAEDLAIVIKHNSDLEQLHLSNNLKSSAVVILEALQGNSKLKVLDLGCNNMTGQVAEDVAIIIKNNSGLEELYLYNNDLKSSAIVILKALQGNSKLKVLNLGCNNMTGQVAEDVAIIIKNNSDLEQLNLFDNDLKSSAVVILKALQRNSKLKVLDLGSNNMTGQVAEDVAIIIKNNSGLEELYLYNNDLKSSAIVILKALQGNSKLKVLNLGCNNMTGQVAEGVAIIIKNNSDLEKLDLFDNDLKSSAVVILKALQGNSKLKVLNLGSNNMTGQVAEDVAIIIKNNSGLEELYLYNNDLKSSAIVILKALQGNSKLKVLNLGCNNMTGQVAEDVAIIIKNNSDLEQLNLFDNDLKSSAVVILKALQRNSKLKVLDLGSNNMTGQVAEDVAIIIKNNSDLEQLNLFDNDLKSSAVVILKALQRNSKLKVLDLCSNNMTGKVAEDLAIVIKNNSSLERLYLFNNDLKLSAIAILQTLQTKSKLNALELASNNITRQVSTSVASVIKNNNNLESLGLAYNKLGPSAVVILQALRHNYKLKFLSLIGNSITGQAAEELASAIKTNSRLNQLHLSNNNLKSSVVVILQALKNISQLETLSLNNNCITNFELNELLTVIKNNPLITKLWLGDNMLQSGLIDIAISCASLTKLQVLELSCNRISPREVVHLVSVIANINSLQALMLGSLVLNIKEKFICQFYHALKEKVVLQSIDKKIFEAMYSEKWKLQFTDTAKYFYDTKTYFWTSCITTMQLVFVDTSQNLSTIYSKLEVELSQVDAKNMIISLFSIIKTLKVLDLGYSNINKEAAVELATALNCNNVLEQLWLRGNVLGADGAAVILTSLQNITTLRVLDLSYNNISSASANGIAAVINSNHFLEQLWLDGNMLMTTGVVIIASALKKHSNLRLLSLSNNEITEDAAEEISAIVNSNTLLGGLLLGNNLLQSVGTCEITRSLATVQTLELTNNCIDETAADELAVSLSNCTCLKLLYLGDNDLGNAGVVKICQAVQSILILQVLSLNNNNITTEAASEICNVIKTNTNLDILLLGGNDLQTNGVLQIADTVKNNNPTMQLLSLSDNNVDEQIKEDIKVMLCDLELLI